MKELKKIQCRLVEIQEELEEPDIHEERLVADGWMRVNTSVEQLKHEYRILSHREQFLSTDRQVRISKWVGVGSIGVGLIAVIASSLISYWSLVHQREICNVNYNFNTDKKAI